MHASSCSAPCVARNLPLDSVPALSVGEYTSRRFRTVIVHTKRNAERLAILNRASSMLFHGGRISRHVSRREQAQFRNARLVADRRRYLRPMLAAAFCCASARRRCCCTPVAANAVTDVDMTAAPTSSRRARRIATGHLHLLPHHSCDDRLRTSTANLPRPERLSNNNNQGNTA